jgi:EAL domain-containing protein (putative c-di-GMP-specific phosphodiesterase class I)
MFSKITIGLFIALLISGLLNYSLYTKLETKNILLEQKEQSIKELNKSNEFNKFVKQTSEDTFKVVLDDIKISEVSFDNLKDTLPKIDDCIKPDVINIKTKETNNENTIDPDVVAYYNVLHNAYKLQSKE